MNTNETQYEPCPLEEATHAKTASNEIYELRRDGSKSQFMPCIVIKATVVWSGDFPTLGITPVRKAEVCPVEFAGQVGGTSFDGHYTEFLIRVKGNVGGNLGEDLLGRTLRFTEVQP